MFVAAWSIILHAANCRSPRNIILSFNIIFQLNSAIVTIGGRGFWFLYFWSITKTSFFSRLISCQWAYRLSPSAPTRLLVNWKDRPAGGDRSNARVSKDSSNWIDSLAWQRYTRVPSQVQTCGYTYKYVFVRVHSIISTYYCALRNTVLGGNSLFSEAASSQTNILRLCYLLLCNSR